MNDGRILVVGATGRVGGAAVYHLLEAGFGVRALVRNTQKGTLLRAQGAEITIGDVTEPGSLAPALEGCAGIFSALSAATDRAAVEVEYRGNLNLLSAAREAGITRFVYSSALLADHPLARQVGTFREKARFEDVLLGAEEVSTTVLRPVMFMETLLMALSGSVAFVPGPQRRPVGWISASDVGRAAARAFERDVTGRHELAGPDTATFDEAYRRLSRARDKRIIVLHPPLAAMHLAGRVAAPVEELANMFTLFDAAGYTSDSPALRDIFGVDAISIEEWAGQVSRSAPVR
ncbi:MAG TPA: NmrA family NAD(P)-binding protein [Rubrobacteraceae bacterium]|nr:NmrA family NAD(P)-binding protein [Rubrobacteraceae bacterium]